MRAKGETVIHLPITLSSEGKRVEIPAEISWNVHTVSCSPSCLPNAFSDDTRHWRGRARPEGGHVLRKQEVKGQGNLFIGSQGQTQRDKRPYGGLKVCHLCTNNHLRVFLFSLLSLVIIRT